MATPPIEGVSEWGAPSALSIAALAGMFSPMFRVVMVVAAVLAFAALTWATGLLGDVLTAWTPSIMAAVGPWGVMGGIAFVGVGGIVLANWMHRRDEARRYVATGILEIEKPHPWPMWLRVLAFAPLALGMVAVIVAASRGI